MSKQHLPLLLCVLFVPLGTANAQHSAGLDFKSRIIAEWNSLLKTINTARWESKTDIISGTDADHLTALRHVVYRRAISRAGGWLWVQERGEYLDGNNETIKKSVTCSIVNPHYAADLGKSKQAEWMLIKLTRGKDERRFAELPFPWMEVGNNWLYYWLQEADFAFTRVEECPDQPGSGILRAHFKAPRDNRKSGFIDFDPAHSYRPVRYFYNTKTKSNDREGIMRGVVEYDGNETGFSVKVMTIEGESRSKRKGPLVFKEKTTFSKTVYNAGVNDEEFRMSFYGLPEPMGVVWPEPSRSWLWLTLAALGCLGLAALSLMVKRRYRSPEPIKK